MSQVLSHKQLAAIAKEFGTPVYIYHAEKISEQYNKLVTAFKKTDSKFFYACKALTNINILRHIKFIGANIDCSSVNEVKLALHAGFTRKNFIYFQWYCF